MESVGKMFFLKEHMTEIDGGLQSKLQILSEENRILLRNLFSMIVGLSIYDSIYCKNYSENDNYADLRHFYSSLNVSNLVFSLSQYHILKAPTTSWHIMHAVDSYQINVRNPLVSKLWNSYCPCPNLAWHIKGMFTDFI